MLKEGYHLFNDDSGRHFFDKVGHVGSRLSSYHGRFIVYQETELAAQLFLNGRGDLLVRAREQATS